MASASANGLLFVALLALSIDTGRVIVRRVLGEREPVTAGALALLFGIAAFGLIANLLWRLSLRVELALLMAVPAIAVVRVGLARVRFSNPDANDRLAWRTRLAVLIIVAAAVLPMALVLGANHMWDEWDAHLPLAISMANGVFPPVLGYMPDTPFLYHYGYDLLAAIAHRLTAIPMDRWFDIQSTVLFAAYILGTAALIRRSAGGTWQPFVFAAALAWTGGLIWIRSFEAGSLASAQLGPLVGWGRFDGYPPLPAPHSYFLQKPMALGLPLWIATLTLLLEADRRRDPAIAVLAGVTLAFLELAQFPLFVLTAATTVTVALGAAVVQRRPVVPSMKIAGLAVAVGVLIAFANGGFLTRPQGTSFNLLADLRVPYFPRTSSEQGSAVSPYLWQMGLPIVLAPLSAWLTVRRRDPLSLWLLIFATASFVVPHLFSHRNTNNIEKFFVLAVVGFALLLLLHAAYAYKDGWKGQAMGLLVTAALVGNAPLWTLYFLRDAPRWTDYINNPSIPYDAAAADWLRAHADPHDRVLTSRIYMAALGGFLTPMPIHTRYQAVLHGWDPTRVLQLTSEVDRALRTLNEEDLNRLGIRWYVRCHLDEVALLEDGVARLSNPARFRRVFEQRHGSEFIEVYEYIPDRTPAR